MKEQTDHERVSRGENAVLENGTEMENLKKTETPFMEVKIAKNAMRADVVLYPPKNEQSTVSFLDVLSELYHKGIRYGILADDLKELVEKKKYHVTIPVALGTMPQRGKDGYYEFCFKTEFTKKPPVANDGTADYKAIETFARVEKGQVLAIYHPAEAGIAGKNVYGEEIPACAGRDKVQLRGKGFSISGDGRVYTADFSGKAEIINKRLILTNVHEVFGDVSCTLGNITFTGDVLIHGSILNGMRVEATGNVEVEGMIEAAYVKAGKNVSCEKGIVGGGKAELVVGGDVITKYIDKANVKVNGSVMCDYCIGCTIEAGRSITLFGEKGTLLGGTYHAYESIECMQIGNVSAIKTKVSTGMTRQMLVDCHGLEQGITVYWEKIGYQYEVWLHCPKSQKQFYKDAIHKNVVMLREMKEQLKEYNSYKKKMKQAIIRVYGSCYPGTLIEIGNSRVLPEDEMQYVSFRFRRGVIETGTVSG